MIDVRLVPCGFVAKAIRVQVWSFAEVAGYTSGLVSILLFVAAFPVLFHMRKQLACPESWHFTRRRFPARNTRTARCHLPRPKPGICRR
jgi:hypothetical protein